MKLHFDVASCVRATSKFSQCTKCVDACPEIITIEENLPAFVNSTGVEAAACVGACPTEAFALSDFSVTEFFFSFLESKVRLVSPKVNVPCLSILSVEHLISLALASDDPVALDLTGYEEGSLLSNILHTRIEEANFVLSSFTDKQLQTNVERVVDETVDTSLEEESSRRDFLNVVSVKGALKQKKTFDDAVAAEEIRKFEIESDMISKIRNKKLSDKRKIFFTVLKRAGIPENFEVLPQEEVSFVSQKYVDDACTNCQICYRICPTGALSSNGKFSLIHFDTMLCVKCHLCHDVCEPNAIHLQNGFEIKEFFEPHQRTLASFTIKRCNECGNNFTFRGGEQICPRCQLEEEEAIFLHDNARKMRGES